eukprot:775165_1
MTTAAKFTMKQYHNAQHTREIEQLEKEYKERISRLLQQKKDKVHTIKQKLNHQLSYIENFNDNSEQQNSSILLSMVIGINQIWGDSQRIFPTEPKIKEEYNGDAKSTNNNQSRENNNQISKYKILGKNSDQKTIMIANKKKPKKK